MGKNIFENINMTESKTREFNPLVLAFLGDGVHTMFVREKVVLSNNSPVAKEHIIASRYCRASQQAKTLDKLMDSLSDDEKQIVTRARNTKLKHVSKNNEAEDYKKATSFEALVGYLYVRGDIARLEQVLTMSMED